MNGHNDVMRLLLDKGANVNSRDKVSGMMWEIVIIVCVSDWFIVIMICDGSVMVTSTSQRQLEHRNECDYSIQRFSAIAHICHELHIFGCMRWDEMRFLHLIMSFILYQGGRTALHWAAMYGYIEVMRLLLDKGADVNIKDKVSGMIWEIVIIVCESDCVVVIMICDGTVIVMSTSHVNVSTMIDINVIIFSNNSLQLHISDMYCTYLGVWDELRWDFSIW